MNNHSNKKRRAVVPPPSPPGNDEEERKKSKKEESVNNVVQNWLEKGNDCRCKHCDSNICHTVLYYQWITCKYKDHTTLYHVPRRRMEQILFHEYQLLRNIHKYVYQQDVLGDIAYPWPFQECPIPDCILHDLQAWISDSIDEQYKDWVRE